MKNQEVKNAIYNAGLKNWQVAECLGLADANFSRKMRYELTGEEKQRIYCIIEDLKNGVIPTIQKVKPLKSNKCRVCGTELGTRSIMEGKKRFCSFECADKDKEITDIQNIAKQCDYAIYSDDMYLQSSENLTVIFDGYSNLKAFMHLNGISETSARNILENNEV